jgi:hypothetical protein
MVSSLLLIMVMIMGSRICLVYRRVALQAASRRGPVLVAFVAVEAVVHAPRSTATVLIDVTSSKQLEFVISFRIALETSNVCLKRSVRRSSCEVRYDTLTLRDQ